MFTDSNHRITRIIVQHSQSMYHRTKKIIPALLAALFIPLCATAEGDSIKLTARHYSMADGLPSNTVRCIHQDGQGFIWLGTPDGLCRYDGNRFSVYRPQPAGSKELGLATNSVTDFFEDHDQYLWIVCSPQRLCCFDLQQGQFVDFTGMGEHNNHFMRPLLMADGDVWLWNDDHIYGIHHLPHRKLDITHIDRNREKILTKGTIKFITKDSDGQVWIGTSEALVCLDTDKQIHTADTTRTWIQACTWRDEVHFVSQDGELWYNAGMETTIQRATALPWMSDKDKVVNENHMDGSRWLIFTNRRIYTYDMRRRKAQRDKRVVVPTPRIVHLDRGDILIYNQPDRVVYADSLATEYIPLPLRKMEDGKPGYESYRTKYDREGNLWIATSEYGLFIFNPKTHRLQHLTHSAHPELMLTDVLHNILIDREGVVWIGTNNSGLTKFTRTNVLDHRRIFPSPTKEMGYENYVRLLTYHNDTLHVGTRRFLTQTYDNDLNLLSSNSGPSNVYCMYTDRNGILWTGTRGRGLVVGNKEIRQHKGTPDRLQNGDIFKILEDRQGRIWIATFGGGLALAHKDTTMQDGYRFAHYLTENYGMLRVRDLAMDRKGRIWAATNDGLCVFHPDSLIANPSAYQHYCYTNGRFPASEIHTLLADYTGANVWAGTVGYGLIRCTLHNDGTFDYTCYTENDGLASNTVTSLIHDDHGYLWIGTTQGLSRMEPDINSLHSFIFSKYPQGNSFTESASCLLPDGRLLFGTIHGFIVLDPRTVNIEKATPTTVITDVWINGRPTPYTIEKGRSTSIPHARQITLAHTQNSFELHFTDMVFNEGHKKRFRWYLEGYDKGWQEPSTRSYATYQYLPAGTYTFHVETTDSDGLWSEQQATLKITVLPPWWLTWWAKLLWVILASTVAYIIFRQVNRIANLRRRIKMEKELANFKTLLFANLSHEFRTPLTLIQVALERLKETIPHNKKAQQAFDTMKQGAERMNRLSYEIMQFHKMEMGQLSLSLQPTDVVAFVRHIANTFNELALQKEIHFSVQTWQEEYTIPIDRNHLDKIVYNLLSNAFKYTPAHAGNSIIIDLRLKDTATLVLTVTDTGIGVPANKRELIFSRHMQSRMSGNSIGIGLNLSAQLASTHHGTLEYKPNISDTGEEIGSIFFLSLPTTPEVYADEDFLQTEEGEPIVPTETSQQITSKETELSLQEYIHEEEIIPVNPQRLLIVEDDADIRDLLVDELSHFFEISTATDGVEGLEKAKEEMPDLVISDVMMPNMDGFEMTRRLKKDFNTCHIPVILLTALGTPEKQTVGFEKGADAYIAKPFNRDVLRARIIQLITQRQRLREKFSKEPGIQNTEICTTNQDRDFLTQLNNLIENNMTNGDLRMEDMAREMGLGRTNFYQKVKGITGLVPIEYLRMTRLKKASELLLSQPHLSMAEISFFVGFNDPLYFSRVFKKHFGVSPSSYRNPKGGNQKE